MSSGHPPHPLGGPGASYEVQVSADAPLVTATASTVLEVSTTSRGEATPRPSSSQAERTLPRTPTDSVFTVLPGLDDEFVDLVAGESPSFLLGLQRLAEDPDDLGAGAPAQVEPWHGVAVAEASPLPRSAHPIVGSTFSPRAFM